MGHLLPTENTELTVSKLRDGGYVVRHVPHRESFLTELFACTDLDEALAYIRGQLIGRSPA